MGFAKQEGIEYQENEEMYEWVLDNFGDDAGEEGTEAWEKAEQAFEDYCEEQGRLEWEDYQQGQLEYYVALTFKDTAGNFASDIAELKKIFNESSDGPHSNTFYKMMYAHAVTILEVYLEALVKSLVVSHDKYLLNCIKNVRPFNETKYNISDIPIGTDGIKKFVLSKLSENLFHNIPIVRDIIEGIVGKKIKINIGDICKITSIRHDIVHRNGKNRDGKVIDIDWMITQVAMHSVEKFGAEIQQIIETNMIKDLESEAV